MQGGGGDPFNFDCPFGGYGGSFGESGGSDNGTPSPMSSFGGDSCNGFGGPNNEPPSQMSNLIGGDSVVGSFGGSNNGPPSLMSDFLGGASADDFGGSFGGSNAGPPSLMTNFFGGRDPFDDPFFTQPFGASMFQPSLFGPHTMDPFAGVRPPPLGFIENHHHQPPQPRLSGGPVIEEIIVLNDEEEGEVYQETRVILGEHGRSSSVVETEEAIAEERRITHMQNMNANAMVNNEQWQQQTQERRTRDMQNMDANAMVNNEQWQQQTQERRITNMQSMNANAVVNNEQWQQQTQESRITHLQSMNANAIMNNEQWQQQTQERRISHMQNMNANAMVNSGQWQPQNQDYSFQSSTVTYGAHDGNYYTSSTTRRTGSDGLTLEESKEANTVTSEAAHMISRGFHNQGHTVERTLNSNGRVSTNQILHNLNEDELASFEQSWSCNAGMHRQFPSLSGSLGGVVHREQPMLLPPTDPSPLMQEEGLTVTEEGLQRI
ncbi:hypothetical protein Bca4012_023349 [Brassica carinata]